VSGVGTQPRVCRPEVAVPARFKAKRGQLKRVQALLTESHGLDCLMRVIFV
jgi:hypothetical protein